MRGVLWFLVAMTATAAAVTATVEGRRVLSVRDGRLYADNVSLITLRAVSYAPSTIGTEAAADLLGPEHEPTWSRDLEAIAALGANAIRLRVAVDVDVDHQPFLAACFALNLTVLGGTMLLRTADALNTAEGLASTRSRLRDELDAMRGVSMWAVGDELNAPSQGFVCNASAAQAPCMFGDEPQALYEAVDSLCRTVVAEDVLCFSPLAEVPPLDDGDRGALRPPSEWVAGWVADISAVTPNVTVHALSAFGGTSFATLRAAHAAVSEKPLLIAAYGIDAFDSVAYAVNVRSAPAHAHAASVCPPCACRPHAPYRAPPWAPFWAPFTAGGRLCLSVACAVTCSHSATLTRSSSVCVPVCVCYCCARSVTTPTPGGVRRRLPRQAICSTLSASSRPPRAPRQPAAPPSRVASCSAGGTSGIRVAALARVPAAAPPPARWDREIRSAPTATPRATLRVGGTHPRRMRRSTTFSTSSGSAS